MIFFDFLFGNKKKKERLEQEQRRKQAEMDRINQEAKRKAEQQRLAEQRRKEEENKRRKVQEQKVQSQQKQTSKSTANKIVIPKPNAEKYPVDINISEEIGSLASQGNFASNMGNRNVGAQYLNALFKRCYGGNGHDLLKIDATNCQPVGLAFANIAIGMDFGDEDLNSVAAENAFYCLARNFITKGNTFVVPAMFSLLLNKPKLMKDKLIAMHCTWAQKQTGMPIGMMLGGNPYRAPQLQEFRDQAVERRIAIMAYLLPYFYDVNTEEYKIPTDMPFMIPSISEINKFLFLQQKYEIEKSKQNQLGQDCFYLLFSECEDTLSKC